MNNLQKFLADSSLSKAVYIDDVDSAFENESEKIVCTLELPTGCSFCYEIRIPEVNSSNLEDYDFVRNYFFSRIYNMISTLGGTVLRFNIAKKDTTAVQLCSEIGKVFGTALPKSQRIGYGKCLNVTDRVNAAMGFPPFRFETSFDEIAPCKPIIRSTSDAIKRFTHAVDTVRIGSWCGLDIGGSDIKVVGVKDGTISVVKEFDWNPSLFRNIEQLIEPVLMMVRLIASTLAVPKDAPAVAKSLVRQILNKETSIKDMESYVSSIEKEFGSEQLWGVGISFPDVVINNMIVGGETLKTRGIRKFSADYEVEFPRLKDLGKRISVYCRPGVNVHIANDGSLAAYTAAVEWAYSEGTCDSVRNGVFAHTLGTELGTGWIDEYGNIPQIPLEVYNCVIDLGNKPAQRYAVTDIRSTRNFNTGIAGTLQKYASQYGAYRIALARFEKEAPGEYEKLFTLGFLEKDANSISVVLKPNDMRKPLLEHLMNLAVSGQPQAEDVFREIGRCLAVTCNITQQLLSPKAVGRILFGRFVKNERCFELICEGAQKHMDIPFSVADNSLAYTPLMLELACDSEHTIAQFGQAIGAVYYAV